MPTSSISGLGSGLDTAGIINQLMQLEAISQSRLQSRVRTEETSLKALQSLNTKFAALATKATDTGKADAWSTLKASSSLTGVTVAATSSAAPTTISVTVDKVALGHQLGFTTPAALTDVVTTGSTTVTLDRLDGTTVAVETGDGTLQGLVSALNDPANATGVRASAVKVADGSYRLLVESTATGAASDFALTNLDGTDLLGGATARAGQDAQLSLGAGITATSTTNTFTDLFPGVSVTLAANAQTGTAGTITLERDPAALSTSMKSLVDDINALLTEIDKGTAYNEASKAKGVLGGDSAVRSARMALVSAIYPGDGTSMSALGLEVDRYGKLVFDEKKFGDAYAADPAAVATAFGSTGDGFAARVTKVAEQASDKYTGTITSSITGRTKGIERLNDSIEAWDARLELRRTTLTRQFTALETALNAMNSQSSWLAGQIGSLPTTEG